MFGIDDGIAARCDFAEETLKNNLKIKLTEMQNVNPHWFVAGWRPFIGWVCGLGIAYQVLLAPVLNGLLMAFGVTSAFPLVDTALLQSLIGGMLGLGVARSYEKSKNVETKGFK